MERSEGRQVARQTEAERKSRRLSFKGIQEYLVCPACFFGKRIRHTLEDPAVRDVVKIGTFLAGVISNAHVLGKPGIKFKTAGKLIGFAYSGYPKLLEGRKYRETEDFLTRLTPSTRKTINGLLASYFGDNGDAKVLKTEAIVKAQLGDDLVWGIIDQIREGRNEQGNPTIDLVEMKFNQKPNIENSFQVGLYAALKNQDPQPVWPIRQIIYDLLGRRRFTLVLADGSLITQIIENTRQAIALGYDGQEGSHRHLPQTKKIGGQEGRQRSFDGIFELTRPATWEQGRILWQEARSKKRAYFESCHWQVEQRRESTF